MRKGHAGRLRRHPRGQMHSPPYPARTWFCSSRRPRPTGGDPAGATANRGASGPWSRPGNGVVTTSRGSGILRRRPACAAAGAALDTGRHHLKLLSNDTADLPGPPHRGGAMRITQAILVLQIHNEQIRKQVENASGGAGP